MNADLHDDHSEPGVAPSKPAAPRRAAPPEPRPEPIDADEAEIIAPNPGPDPEEVQPSAAPAAVDEELTTQPRSTYEALGAAAAFNAALNAGGAPTPLAGVPLVSGAHVPPDADLSDGEEPFEPRFAGDDARRGREARAETMAGLEAGLATTIDGDDEPYAPAAFAHEDGDDQEDQDDPDRPEEASDVAPPVPRRPGHAWPLVLVGLVTMAGLAYGAYLLLGTPEEIEIPAQRVVAEQPVRVLDPITLENPTPFLAAIPAAPGLWAMTAAQTVDPEIATGAPGRLAEVHRLTYSDGTAEVRLRAYQLYGQDKAQESLRTLAGDAEVTAHTVAGTEVGLETRLAGEAESTVVWTNGGALFIAEGAEADVADLVRELGL